MIKNANGSVTFTKYEAQSLTRLINQCNDKIGNLVNDVDFLGSTQDYRALQMWDDTLLGREGGLLDYLGDDSEALGCETIFQWLEKHGGKQ